MKRTLSIIILCFICLFVSAKLPKKSLVLINRHYPQHTIKAYHKVDKYHFVLLNDDTRLWFKSNGDLIEAEGYVNTLIIPYQITNHMLWHYPNKKIRKYSKHKKGHSIYLRGGKRIEYNKRYKERK